MNNTAGASGPQRRDKGGVPSRGPLEETEIEFWKYCMEKKNQDLVKEGGQWRGKLLHTHSKPKNKMLLERTNWNSRTRCENQGRRWAGAGSAPPATDKEYNVKDCAECQGVEIPPDKQREPGKVLRREYHGLEFSEGHFGCLLRTGWGRSTVGTKDPFLED